MGKEAKIYSNGKTERYDLKDYLMYRHRGCEKEPKDFNSYTETGFYSWADTEVLLQCDNRPCDELGMLVVKNNESTENPIIYHRYVADNGDVFLDVCISGVWGGWVEQATKAEVDDVSDRLAYIEENGVTTGDTLPVGTIVSFDSDVVPPNYEEVAPPFCNENILDNADFKSGIINQQGQVVYENSGYQKQYGIDRWYSIHSKVNTQYKDLGYLTISVNEQQEGYFNQPLEIQAGTYCLAIKVININRGNINVYIEQAQPQHEETIDKVGLHTFVFKTTSKGSGISFRLNDFSGDIEFIKLERGEDFTGMPKWDKAIEELKCSAFYRQITGEYFTTNTTKVLNVMHKLYPYMNKNPEIKSIDLSNENGTIYNLTIKVKGLDKDGVWWISFNEDLPKNANIRWTIKLDANDY